MAPRSAAESLESRPLSATIVAALLVFARQHLVQFDLPHPSVAQILDATGAKKSRAYELGARVPPLLSQLVGPNGRPPKPTPPSDYHAERAVTQSVMAYMMAHPGCVHTGSQQNSYSSGFRRYIVSLREQHAQMELSLFAELINIPYYTVQDWLRSPVPSDADTTCASREASSHEPSSPTKTTRISSVIAAWKTWEGNFLCFCKYVRKELRIPYGVSMIRGILEMHGVRIPKRRPGRSSADENAIRGQFENFFPGAQWQGDGTPVSFILNGEKFTFNLELMIDPASGAWVGMSVRDEEDGQAVVDAFQDGIQNTGAKPLAVLLDHRPANQTDKVQNALKRKDPEAPETPKNRETLLILATKGRGQNKAHAEGGFGLFFQKAPPLEIEAHTIRELLRQCLEIIVQVYGRTLNHRPRTNCPDGSSRFNSHKQSHPTEGEYEAARQALKKRQQRQEERLKNQASRADPVVRKIVEQALARLGLEDPKHRFRDAISTHDRDAVLEGIAIFEGKKKNGTLKPGVDARYLLGIIKNLHNTKESEAIMQELIERRIEMRDAQLLLLEKEKTIILQEEADPRSATQIFVEKIAYSERMIDTFFWTRSVGEMISRQPQESLQSMFRSVARQIRASFEIPTEDRDAAIRQIAQMVWPVS